MAGVVGRRVLVTRAAGDAERWAARLVSLGAVPMVLPCLVCEPIDDAATVRALRDALDGAGWLLMASPRGVDAVASLLGGTVAPSVRLAAVGPATTRAVASRFGRVDLVPDVATSRGLATALIARLTPGNGGVAAGGHRAVATRGRIVIAGAAGGRDDAEVLLSEAGLDVVRVNVYRTIPSPPAAAKRDLAADGVEDVLLASPSAVTGLLNLALLPRSARVITIGPTTTAAARAAGLDVAAEARRPDLDGMLEAMQ